MRIIRDTNIEKEEITFECKKCGCEFACEKDEYWVEQNLTSLNYPPSHAVHSCCPKCHKVCTAYKRDKVKAPEARLTLNGTPIDTKFFDF